MISRAMKLTLLAASIATVVTVAAPAVPANAMPMFAKAYGIKCSVCHTIVPALNAYGRYVQRTAYSSLNRDVLKTTAPIWIGEQLNGDSAGGVSSTSPTFTNSAGNLAIHGAGYIAPDWTYHVQQWLLQNDQTGGVLDTAWVTYNNLFHRDGHLFLGKVEAPGPSPFSMWPDISTFATPEISVGEHGYALDANRWGAKFGYVHKSLTAEAGWLAGGGGLPVSADYGNAAGTDKTFQYKVASARPDQPLEYGVFGSNGTYALSTGATDYYHSFAGYVQRDPQRNGVPGIVGMYQWGYDGNPGLDASGNQLHSANSRAFSAEIYEPIVSNNAVVLFREDMTNDGLGNVIHYGNVDLAFNVPHIPYLHGYVEAGLGGHSGTPNATPDYRYILWWTTPLP